MEENTPPERKRIRKRGKKRTKSQVIFGNPNTFTQNTH